MKKEIVCLSLGSNQGDRRENIRKALSLLDEAFGTECTALSSIIETEPWGFEAEEKFLNAVVAYTLGFPDDYDPQQEGLRILKTCKSVERALGRTDGPLYDGQGRRIYSSRPIDVDILLFGGNKIDCEELTVPHRLMEERDFVMIPLREIQENINQTIISL